MILVAREVFDGLAATPDAVLQTVFDDLSAAEVNAELAAVAFKRAHTTLLKSRPA